MLCSRWAPNSQRLTSEPPVAFPICGDVHEPAIDTSYLLAHVHVTTRVPESLTSNLGKSVRICESLSW